MAFRTLLLASALHPSSFILHPFRMQDWTIQSRTDRCDVTGQPFADGESFYTLLYRDRDDTLSRRDVSAEGWRRLKTDKTAPRPF